MAATSPTNVPINQSVYRIQPSYVLRMILLVALFCVAVGWALSITMGNPDRVARIVISSGITSMVLIWWLNHSISLTVTPDHIVYYSPLYTLTTRWDNVEAITPPPGVLWSRGECLQLRWPGELSQDAKIVQSNLAQYIPVGQFAHDWRDSDLGKDIRRYAPWTFPE